MKPDPKPKKIKKKRIDWTGFAVPKQAKKLSSSEYTKLKKLVHKLDGWRCINPDCSNIYSVDELTIHHIIPVSRGRIDTVDNCCTLCLRCHTLVEDKILYLDFEELLEKRKLLTGFIQ